MAGNKTNSKPRHAHKPLIGVLLLLLQFAYVQASADVTEDKIFYKSLAYAALERTRHQVTYDGSYRKIPYPMGDVPEQFGVCTDVVIRSYRTLGIDLQQLVHEDMRRDFAAYPNQWGLHKPDSNIDHRRVPNLQAFFTRHGKKLAISLDAKAYHPGDLVTWMLPGNLPHIGIVSDQKSQPDQRPLMVHNIGSGPKLEDILFEYKITGHYRYNPNSKP